MHLVKPWAPPYPVSFLSMIIFGLSALLDTGEHDDVTIEEVKQHARSGDLLQYLKELGGGYFASNMFDGPDFDGFGRWYGEQIAASCVSMDGRERRKYGVENRGLCLLISYTAEIIQTGPRSHIDFK